MTVLSVITFPNPVLRQKAVDVEIFDDKLKKLVADMFETLAHYGGVGLAAPQISVLERVLIVSFEGKKLTLINPEIIVRDDILLTGDEGCLSVPEEIVTVTRPDKIELEAKDIKGNIFNLKLNGWISRIVQHELDHLNGVLILDKL